MLYNESESGCHIRVIFAVPEGTFGIIVKN
jgi:hypothetical protein